MLGLALASAPSAQQRQIGINVVLNTDISDRILADLSAHGSVLNTHQVIDALTMRVAENQLAVIRAKPYVAAANPDAERKGSPVDTVNVSDFGSGINTWNLDAVNVTNFSGTARQVPQDGSGVYVAVLDSGLLDSWRQYFPEQRIAAQYALAFSGGGGERGHVSEPRNQWEHDQNSHGTHVTSAILGFNMGARVVNGVAPRATVIPVKVLNQAGFGWSSVIAAGIMHVADPTTASDFYITDFSSREKPGQDLDVAAPGSWTIGPYQLQSGKASYFFLGGTSMASPHVAGIAALLMQKNSTLNQAQVENILETTAIPLPPGCRNVVDPNVGPAQFCWAADASGSGLATADRALAAVTGGTTRSRRSK